MDRPKREASWLESFPPDIWAYVSSYLPGEELGRLMITGATLLRRHLKSPHVVKSINLGQDFIIFNSFPRFLYDFPSLEELSIHSMYDDWSHKLGLTIDLIPSGVKKLELTGEWDAPAKKLFGESAATLTIDKRLPYLQVLELSLLKYSSFMTHSPQSLTKLSVARWDGNVEFPSSLIHVMVGFVILSSDSFVSKVPPSLESFQTYALRGFDLLLPLLPSSTHELSMGHWPDRSSSPSSLNLLEQLPKYLTRFDLPTSKELDFVTNPKLISLLPSTMTWLRISSEFPCSAWPYLPQQLTTLICKSRDSLFTVVSELVDGVRHEFESIPFENLPRSITSIHLLYPPKEYFCSHPSTVKRSYFPPRLISLKMPKIQLAPETSKLLPSTITDLEIGNFCERVCKHLPAGLKTLIASKTLLSPNLIKYLPTALTSFLSSAALSTDSWFEYDTGQCIESISKLPEYSIHKMCVSNKFNWKDHTPLPPTLTFFDLSEANELGDSFLAYQQFPNMVELNFRNAQHFSDISFPLLPPYLTVLKIPFSRQISGNSFKYLPRCLTHLDLNSSESIFDPDIKHLPRTLKQLNLSDAMHLTDLCIPDLPRHLEKLIMRNNKKISPDTYPHLPYPLRSSQLNRLSSETVQFWNWGIHKGVLKKRETQADRWWLPAPSPGCISPTM